MSGVGGHNHDGPQNEGGLQPETLTQTLMTVIGVLWTERGISYDRLCSDYNIDRRALDFIRTELVDIKRIAREVGGHALVWTGDGPAVVAPPDAPSLDSKDDTHFIGDLPSARIRDGVSQRRQLTIMFCDIVGSTNLSSRSDPEDLREILQKFRNYCEAAISEFGGRTASYMGDGLMVHFGYPHAHEDAAVRAARTALTIIENMDLLNAEIGMDGVELSLRVGIATGSVVIENTSAGPGPEESSVVGETPNLAARLQGEAEPNQIILDGVTQRLIGGQIELEEIGARQLKGLAAPVPLWRAVRERADEHMIDDLLVTPEQALIGRDEEMRLLARAWDTSRANGGQVAFVHGEAGVGKTRLLQALRGHSGDAARWITLRGSANQQSTALYPVMMHLKRELRTEQAASGDSAAVALETLLAKCRQINPLEAVPLVAEFLSIEVDERKYPPPDMTSEQRRETLLDILNDWIAGEAEETPLILAWEDLHWSDPSTFRMMELLIDQIPTMPVLLVGTYRSDFELPIQPRSSATSIAISRLAAPEIEALTLQVAGEASLPRPVLDHIIEKSDGVPLFVEELTKSIMEADILSAARERPEMIAQTIETQIPSTLHDTLMARLDRVPFAKRIAQVGAVLGRDFDYEVLAAVVDVSGDELEQALGHLVRNEILYQRGRPPRSRYFFKHALIQDASYQCLLRDDRQKLHRSVVNVLQSQFAVHVADAPELLARHLNQAGEYRSAAEHWREAGERASEQSAYLEAVDYFDLALAALGNLDESPDRFALEAKINFLLGAAYFMTKGHGAREVETAYSRARELCAKVEDAPDTFQVLSGLWRCFVMRPELETACDLGEQLLRVAEREDAPSQAVIANCAAGINAFYVGDFESSIRHGDASLATYQLNQRDEIMYRAGTDPAVLNHAYSSWSHWLLGDLDRAVSRTLEMCDHANITEHPFSVAASDCYAAVTFRMMRDHARVKNYSERAIQLSEKRGFKFWWAYATVQRGSALTREGRMAEGIARMREGIREQSAGGAAIKVPFWKGLLAEALLADNQVDEALAVLAEALDMTKQTGDRFAEAELLRLQGEALLRRDNNLDQTLSVFEQSLDVARAQKALSWQLRTALGIARVRAEAGQADGGADLIADIVRGMHGGRQSQDMHSAYALLRQAGALSESVH